MAPSIPTVVPSEIRAGDTVRFTRQYADYPVGESWVARFTLSGPGKAGCDATTSGSDFLFALAPADTKELAPGTYQYAITVTLAGARYTAQEGVLAVLADLTTSTVGTLETQDEQELRALNAEILARAQSDHTEYTIGDRSLKREPLPELLAWRNRLRARIAQRRNGGQLPKMRARFSRGTA